MRPLAIASLLLDSLQRLINLLGTLLIVCSLVLFVIPFVGSRVITAAWPIVRLQAYGTPVMIRLAHLLHAPVRWMPLVAGVALIVLLGIVTRLLDSAHAGIERAKFAARKRASAQPQPQTLGVDSEKTREQLFKEYRKIEKALTNAKRRQCTFLSIDVVGSTKMKAGESDIAITSTFRAYEQLLKRTFRETHAWKESWTPDGVMICYLSREDAVRAAQTILQELVKFNDGENALKTRFEVRSGVNEGEVVVFEDSDLEKLVEHVIDVAGHMQKYAKPGTLLLSSELYHLLEDQSGFAPTGQEVDGYATYEWSPRVVA